VERPDESLGPEQARLAEGTRPGRELHRVTFQTTLEDANLVGNVYYSNYFKWQGRVRDLFFQPRAPALYRGTGASGELRVVASKAEFLRDAMPFDRVEVVMHLQAVHERGLRLRFEYFAQEPNGASRKLAFGEHDVAWVVRGQPSPLPPELRAALSA